MKKILVYDLEIENAVQDKRKGDAMLADIKYCDGWDDHKGMGITVIGAYDYAYHRYRVFLKDNFDDFVNLCRDRLAVSFNGIGFDNKVLQAVLRFSPTEARCYDVLREMWAAAGLPPEFNYKTHGGLGLNTTAKVNFNLGKTDDGGLAPVEWQRGNHGRVIDYCLQDVKLTKMCFDRVVSNGGLRDPRDASRFLAMRKPVEIA